MVGGAFGVALTLGSGVLASRGVGLAYSGWSALLVPGSGPGLFLHGVSVSHFKEGGALEPHWPERGHPCPEGGLMYIYILF